MRMWHTIRIVMGTVAAAIGLLAGTGQAQPPAAWTVGYDYPHRLSTDYMYRTDRVVANGGRAEGSNQVSALRRERRQMDAESDTNTGGIQQPGEANLRLAVQDMVHQLLQSGGEEDAREHVVAVSTFVNLNQLYRTSALGRYLSEQMISELHEAGVQVVEVRKTPGLMVSQDYGEYTLSRDMDELSYIHQADAVIAGTYTVADGKVYINARLLNNEDGLVLASASFESVIGPVINGMLADESMPVKPQRPIEVKTLAE